MSRSVVVVTIILVSERNAINKQELEPSSGMNNVASFVLFQGAETEGSDCLTQCVCCTTTRALVKRLPRSRRHAGVRQTHVWAPQRAGGLWWTFVNSPSHAAVRGTTGVERERDA